MAIAGSGKPALAALVVLDVLERAPPLAANTEIEFLHVLVLAQILGLAIHDDAAGFENVAVGGVAQRDVGVLLGQQERHALLLVEFLDDLEDLFLAAAAPAPSTARPAGSFSAGISARPMAHICCSPPDV
jgi:hypothetical protein